MPRAIWTGSLSFGLVSIPVKLYGATAPKDVRFHQFEAGTGRRIRHRRVASGGGAAEEARWGAPSADETTWDAQPVREADRGPRRPPEPSPWPPPGDDSQIETAVQYHDMVKGYEVDPGRYVMVAPAELEGLAPEQTRAIEIEAFVDLSDIDPVYFDRTYYVAPQRGGERPYALLLRAMGDTAKVGIARFVLRSREHLAAVRPMEGVLGLETLFFADEVRHPSEIFPSPGEPEVSERELGMARQLIEFLATPWEPERYPDTYRERVLELIQAKVQGREAVVEEEAPAAPAGPDLMAALRASIEAARGRRADGAGGEGSGRGIG